jgi:hypothetical protein
MIFNVAAKQVDILLFALCFGSFTWGIHFFFNNPRAMPKTMKVTERLGAALACWQFVALLKSPHSDHRFQIAAALVYASSFVLFWWTIYASWKSPPSLAFTNDIPICLTIRGPYRYVPVPLRSSSILRFVHSHMDCWPRRRGKLPSFHFRRDYDWIICPSCGH